MLICTFKVDGFYYNEEDGFYYDVDDVTNYSLLWQTDKIGRKILNDATHATKLAVDKWILDNESVPNDAHERVIQQIVAERTTYEACEIWKNKTRPSRKTVSQIQKEILEIAKSELSKT